MQVERAIAALLLLMIVAPIRADESPDIEMLEYLGSWETAQGEYMDPMAIETEDTTKPTNQEKVSDEQ